MSDSRSAASHVSPEHDAGKLADVLARHRRLANLGEMAATLAHQIRTPLSAALLYTSNAANETLPLDRRQELLNRAMNCLHDLEFLVGDMLRFARGAGSRDEAASLPDLLMGVERAASALLRDEQELGFGTPPGDVRVVGQRESLQGALLNLISNGLQAAGPGARVFVSTKIAGAWVEVSVSDNGPGIPAVLRGRVFDPFYTTRPDGTGLGLAVVKSVVESVSGDVLVDESLAGGARITLRLPVATAPHNLASTRS